MVFFCYRCHKTIYNVSPAYHNLSCKVPFRNRNNHNNNSIIRNRFNHCRFNNAHNHRSNRYNNLDSWNNESINRFNRNIERIRLNNNDNNNNINIEIPDAFLQNRNEVLINNIIRRNNERDNNVNEINDNNDNENHNNDDFEEIEDISESDNENALDEGIINTFPKAIIDNIENLKEKNCAICLEDFKKGEEQMTIPCFHMFHSNCISPWFELHNCCPVCKLNCNCKNSNIYKYSNRLF